MKISTISKLILVSTFVISLQSCDTQGSSTSTTSTAGLNTVKQMMTSSTNQGFSVLGNSNSFITNALIEAVMPDELKKINTKLENLGLSSLVTKEKEYIGKAAESSVNVAKPIITSAIQEMTISDAVSILSGGKGAATEYLKNKTQSKLIAAIQPQVESQLNSNGLTSLINNATKDKSVKSAIDALLGNKQSSTNSNVSSSISQYASQQIVDGLFEVAKDYEMKNSISKSILGTLLGGSSN
ncbi:DUF4197 domain-containing protein [Apibacter raozihei]|uniref:DUF4197 domain-containing protein n=1 Tax=Apibacter raozihei TaxID=2500547 RepID=UPI000FE3F74F|nr:DUF4197 domain-containing protein [Apibacter raozihei]